MPRYREDELIFNFGKAIKIMLERKKMNQGDIVRATGLGRSYVSALVNNKVRYPRFETIGKVAGAFGVSTEYFIRLGLKK